MSKTDDYESVVVVSVVDGRTGEAFHGFYYSPYSTEYLSNWFGEFPHNPAHPLRICGCYCPSTVLRIMDVKDFDEIEACR